MRRSASRQAAACSPKETATCSKKAHALKPNETKRNCCSHVMSTPGGNELVRLVMLASTARMPITPSVTRAGVALGSMKKPSILTNTSSRPGTR